jgi:hypothetical protein
MCLAGRFRIVIREGLEYIPNCEHNVVETEWIHISWIRMPLYSHQKHYDYLLHLFTSGGTKPA